MAFTLGIAQCRYPDDGNVVASVGRWAQRASGEGVDLLVFPEALMTKFDGSVERFSAAAQPLDGPFASNVCEIAASHGMWMCFTMNEAAPDGALPFNTAVLADSSGERRGIYRKVHLFDAQGYRESDRMSAGEALMEPVSAPFANIGLGICYDLRFPEVARYAAQRKAQLLLYPAAWVGGPGKVAQWQTLLRARAIENGVFVAGACCADEGRIGRSCVYAPDGTALAEAGADEELLVCAIDITETERVQSIFPTLSHRRPDCYGR